jgi:hypothetical protein
VTSRHFEKLPEFVRGKWIQHASDREKANKSAGGGDAAVRAIECQMSELFALQGALIMAPNDRGLFVATQSRANACGSVNL